MRKKKAATHICPVCGTEAAANERRRGNIFIELVLWLFLIIPGIIYSSWRLEMWMNVCRLCGHERMISLNTPMGRKLHAELQEYRENAVALNAAG